MAYELILRIFTYVGFIVVTALLLLLAGFAAWLAMELFKVAYHRTRTYRLFREFAKENWDYMVEWRLKKEKEKERDGRD